ncbi:MAG: phosphodiesterase [Gammaproteobacteria bacterium]
MTTATIDLDILQLTDSHLFEDPERQLKGVATCASFRRTLQHALALWQPDIILLTGDISEDQSPESYRFLRETLEPAQTPVFCIPGNHDDPTVLASILDSDNFHYCQTLRRGNWLLPMLNTWDGERAGGRIGADQLAELDQQLADTDAEHALICLHHQPVPVGSAWLDSVGLADRDALMAVLSRHSRVRGLLWGHIHQTYDQRRDGLRLMGTPSTCYQFVPGVDAFALDRLGPGFRRLKLRRDGSMDSQITQLDP